jgi:hypothetical protein
MNSPTSLLLYIFVLAFSLPSLAASPGPHPLDDTQPVDESVGVLWDRAEVLSTKVSSTLDLADMDLRRHMPGAALHRFQEAMNGLKVCVDLYNTLYERDPSMDGKANAMAQAGHATETLAETRDMIRLLRQMTPRNHHRFNAHAPTR